MVQVSVGSGTQVLSTTGGTGVKWINAGSGTVTSVSGGGIATDRLQHQEQSLLRGLVQIVKPLL